MEVTGKLDIMLKQEIGAGDNKCTSAWLNEKHLAESPECAVFFFFLIEIRLHDERVEP
jgi:hypothetical protein